MKIKNLSSYLLLGGLMVLVFNACEKENMDEDKADEEVATPVVKVCDDIQVLIEANPDLQSTVNGGIPPYTYLWSTGDTTENLIPSGIGAYGLTVTDNEGCTGTNSFTLKAYDPCDFIWGGTYFEPTNPEVILAEMFNGTAPYTYYWSTGDTSQTISAPGGSYAVAVYDANDCGLSVFSGFNPCLSLTTQIEENPSGTLTANTDGVTEPYPYMPYTYLWSTGETTKIINVTSSGTYSVTVEDVFGCTAGDEIDL